MQILSLLLPMLVENCSDTQLSFSLEQIMKNMTWQEFDVEWCIVITAGGARRARRIAKYLNMKIALIESRLENENPVANVVGTIEENAVIVDDMIDTGHTLDFLSVDSEIICFWRWFMIGIIQV